MLKPPAVLRERIDRIGGIISRAEQARFLAGHGEEDDRALGAAGAGMGLGQRDQSGGAAGIVDGAVADPVRRRSSRQRPRWSQWAV